MKYKSVEHSFFSKIDQSKECWEWKASFLNNRYGAFYDGTRIVSAHRYSFELHNGEIPQGKVIMHSCDNTKCVNPDHLVLGTQKENIHDMIKKGRANYSGVVIARKVRLSNIEIERKARSQSQLCKYGHDLTKPNSLVIRINRPNKSGYCRACARISTRKYNERKKNEKNC